MKNYRKIYEIIIGLIFIIGAVIGIFQKNYIFVIAGGLAGVAFIYKGLKYAKGGDGDARR